MRRWRRMVLNTAAMAAVVFAASTTTASVQPSHPEDGNDPFTFAAIGDIPYGDAQIGHFPTVVDQINADGTVQLVTSSR